VQKITVEIPLKLSSYLPNINRAVSNEHLPKVQPANSGAVSYLSSESQNEFIKLFGDHIRTEPFQRF